MSTDYSTEAPNGASGNRSLWWQALGASCGLALAGYSLFTARGTSTLTVPAEDVALVNQQPISRSDYLAQINTLFSVKLSEATPEQRRKVLEDMIREEIFVQRGKELDLAETDAEVRSALVNAVEMEVSADALTSQPTEATLRTYFSARRERYASEGRMTVQDLVNGVDTKKTKGEEFYFAARIHLGERLFEAAKKLTDGASSEPIRLADGLHVMRMQQNIPPILIDYEGARERVQNDYRNERIQQLKAEDEVFLRKRANVLIAEDLK